MVDFYVMACSEAGARNVDGATALLVYAVCFSLAYVGLSAATGALLLFCAVQVTMIGYGTWVGERLRSLHMATGGLVSLLLPGLSAPLRVSSNLMLCAGAAWGVYSLFGRRGGDPTWVTTGNLVHALPLALLLSFLLRHSANFDIAGVGYAIASGALTSGVGYAIWYAVLPSLQTTFASTVQLSVPPITALGGIVFLGESISLQLVLSSAAILAGVWQVHQGAEATNSNRLRSTQ